MLDLMGFKNEFVSLCRDALCESGQVDMKIEERMVNKAQRGVLNGILFKKDGMACAPTFYAEDFYMAYKEGSSIEDLSHEAIETAVSSMDLAGMLALDSSTILGNPEYLRVRLLSKSRNRDYLKDIPFSDVGCGFVYIAEAGYGEYGAVITEEIMKEYEMTKDELFDIALRNTVEKYPPVMQDLSESIMSGPDECENLLERSVETAPAGAGPGFVLTNSLFFWGAGALFYPGVMGRIHDLFGGDFYVLPSSVHEFILIAEDDQDPERLVELIRSANRSVVKDNDILADDLYICRSGKLCRISYGGVIPACGDMLC